MSFSRFEIGTAPPRTILRQRFVHLELILRAITGQPKKMVPETMINLLWLHVVTDQHPNSAQQSPAAIGSLHVT